MPIFFTQEGIHMCGILGIINRWISKSSLDYITDLFSHRGPDEREVYDFGLHTISTVRLSLKDKHIKIKNYHDDIRIIFNGEIWNYQDIADMLNIENASELSVLYAAYERWNDDFVKWLDGMFAICILDLRKKKILLFRDPIGIKPLFYCYDVKTNALLFASDIKTLVLLREEEPSLNTACLSNLATLGFSDFDNNLFSDVKQLYPSTYLSFTWQTLGYEIKNYTTGIIAKGPFVQKEILKNAIKKCYLHADPQTIGLLLSGGIDSSLLAFIAREQGFNNIQCIYIGTTNDDDFKWAHLVANMTGYPLYFIDVNLIDIEKDLLDACFKLSGQFGSLYLYYYFSEIKRAFPEMKIILSGEGADELYAGYFFHVRPDIEVKRSEAKIKFLSLETNLIVSTLRDLNSSDIDGMYCAYYKKALHMQLVPSHLIPGDVSAMAHGIELRFPYLDLLHVSYVLANPPLRPKTFAASKASLKKILKEISGIKNEKFYFRKKNSFPVNSSIMNHQLDVLALKANNFCYYQHHPLSRFFNNVGQIFWYDIVQLALNHHRINKKDNAILGDVTSCVHDGQCKKLFFQYKINCQNGANNYMVKSFLYDHFKLTKLIMLLKFDALYFKFFEDNSILDYSMAVIVEKFSDCAQDKSFHDIECEAYIPEVIKYEANCALALLNNGDWHELNYNPNIKINENSIIRIGSFFHKFVFFNTDILYLIECLELKVKIDFSLINNSCVLLFVNINKQLKIVKVKKIIYEILSQVDGVRCVSDILQYISDEYSVEKLILVLQSLYEENVLTVIS